MENGIPNKSSARYQKHARALAILKESMLRISRSQNPSHSNQESLERLIDARLPSLVPYPLHTPNHPPYAQMIITALQELKKKMGSTKESISRFIKSRHHDLPLAHEHLLTHHLEKLVQVGEIISIKKIYTLYTLPVIYSTNCCKQQGEQHIVVGEEAVRGEMSSHGGNEGLVPQHKKRRMTSIQPESVGGDDGGTTNNEVVTESADSLQNKVTVRGRGRRPKIKNSPYVNDGLVAQPQKRAINLVEPESMGGDDDGGMNQTEIVTEQVDSLQNKVSVHGQGRHSNEKSSLPVTDELVTQSKKLPLTLTNLEPVGADDGVTKHTDVQNESVDSLQNKLIVRGRGRPPKEKSKVAPQNASVRSSERIRSKAVVVYAATADDDPALGYHSPLQQPRGPGRPAEEKFKIEHIQQVGSQDFATQDDTGRSMTLFENQSTAVDEMVKPLQIKLSVRGRGRPPKNKSVVKQHQEDAEKTTEAIPSELDTGGSMVLFENQPTTVVEMANPLQTKLPVRGRGRPPKKSVDKRRQEEAEKTTEAVPYELDTGGSMTLFGNQPTTVVEMANPLQITSPVRDHGRPPNKKSVDKQLPEEAEKTTEAISSELDTGRSMTLFENQPTAVDETMKPLQIELPVRGRGRPPKKSVVKQHQEEAEKISEEFLSVLEISEIEEQQQDNTPVLKKHEDKPQEETQLGMITTTRPTRSCRAKGMVHSSQS